MRPSRVVAMLCVLALVFAGGWYALFRQDAAVRVAADFATVDGIYPGSRVAVLGVPVGTVEDVRPHGTAVRVSMSLPAGTTLPAGVHAYVMSPAVVSDRFVELGPAYTGGPELAAGSVIPVERTHAPIKWDELTRSLDTLLTALGPDGANNGGGVGALIRDAARMLGGNGEKFRAALDQVAQASELVAGQSGDLGAVLENLERLTALLAEHKSTVDSLSRSVSSAAADFTSRQQTIADTIGRLSAALAGIKRLLDQHGDQLGGDLGQLADLSTTLVTHQRQLAETLDTLPLALQNFGRAVTPDERLRIRLDISTNLSQFPATAQLCRRFPLPLCSGAGLVNPIPFPPEIPNALGLGGATGGGN